MGGRAQHRNTDRRQLPEDPCRKPGSFLRRAGRHWAVRLMSSCDSDHKPCEHGVIVEEHT
jgi:hypothetical protein